MFISIISQELHWEKSKTEQISVFTFAHTETRFSIKVFDTDSSVAADLNINTAALYVNAIFILR